jgi:predicted acetyltransferase
MKIDRLLRTDGVWKISLSTEDEQDVSRLWIHEYQMRFGTAQLKLAGIAGVGTNEEHRNKGYSRCVMEDSTAFMTESGFDVAMLFGIPDFYPKFGYATVLPETWIELDTEEAQAAASTYQIRKFEAGDVPAILALYAANNAERTGTPLRDGTRWKEFKMGSNFGIVADPFVILNETDEVIGYFVCDDTEEKCILCDIGFQSRAIFETIIRFLGDCAKRIGAAQIECSIPADHPFTIFCRRYGCRTSADNPKDRGGMMRIINQSSTLKGITGELEKRLRRSAHLSQWSGKILISTDLGQDCLGIDRGRVAYTSSKANAFHLDIPQDKLIQLMMGRRSIEDLAVEPDVSVTGGIIPILEILFPLDYPHVWWPDRF